MSVFWSTLIASLVGGTITGGFALLAVCLTYKYERKKQEKAQENIIKGLLQAIYDEVDTTWNIYQDGIGVQLESLKDNEPLFYHYSVYQEYFPVYHGNTSLIGHINDHDLRKSIVTTYTIAKGLIDSYKMNNELLLKNEHWYFLYKETFNESHKANANSYEAILITYSSNLKKSHEELKQHVQNLLRSLNKKGVLT